MKIVLSYSHQCKLSWKFNRETIYSSFKNITTFRIYPDMATRLCFYARIITVFLIYGEVGEIYLLFQIFYNFCNFVRFESFITTRGIPLTIKLLFNILFWVRLLTISFRCGTCQEMGQIDHLFKFINLF